MRSVYTFNPILLVPTYNNAQTLGQVVSDLLALGHPVMVVNDGATDSTAEVLKQFASDARVTVVTHEINKGKAAALKTGFSAALERGFTHAATIDSDGQLAVSDLPNLLAASKESPESLVIGVRDDLAGDYPARSRTGRRVSNFFVQLECGLRVSDSQCGLRVYPLEWVTELKCPAERFGFETEIITRTGWAGGTVREVPVSCKYLPEDKRVSHFRPWVDSWRAVAMHLKLVARAWGPFPHRKLIQTPQEKAKARAWQRLWQWFSPARMWRELREQSTAPREMAMGLALGVFIANLPIYGLQTLFSLYTARRLHLNPLTVVAASHISTPPFGPLLIALGVGVGHFILHGHWLTVAAWPESFNEWIHLLGKLMLEWTVGSFVVGAALGTMVFFAASALLKKVAVERE